MSQTVSSRFSVRTLALRLCAGILAFTATALSAADIGVKVNGVDISAKFGGTGTSAAWAYLSPFLALSGKGPFVISGSNVQGTTTNAVEIVPNTNCTVVASNLFIDVSSKGASALYVGAKPYAVTLLLAGTNTLAGGKNYAGIDIESGAGSLTISNLDAAATLDVRGGEYGAGIGGQNTKAGGTVIIAGGNVSAVGGYAGAGIGGGADKSGGNVTISGGDVSATGGFNGAGIGGGNESAGGTLTVSGGNVRAARGCDWYYDIGGWVGSGSSTNTFTGGSIYLSHGSILAAPSNTTESVFCVTFTNVTDAATLADIKAGLAKLSPSYGVNDITAPGGNVYAWLPNGVHMFTIGGKPYVANVVDAPTTVSPAMELTVNGKTIASGSGEGWTFRGTALSLTGAGPFVVSGDNKGNRVSIVPGADCTVVASNLVLDVSSAGGSALDLGNRPYAVTLLLAGTNTFAGGNQCAGICIESGKGSLAISNLDATATLDVRGGEYAAGIGGGKNGAGGSVTISGGGISVSSGIKGAGIGGGQNGAGGTVTISGGTVVATGDTRSGAGDIGYGVGGSSSGRNTFAGGSISLSHGSISSAPSNTTESVFCVTFTNVTDAATLADIKAGLAKLSPSYGVNDITAPGGNVYAWLPNGVHMFTIGGKPYVANVVDAPTTVSPAMELTVNGKTIASGSGEGWTFRGTALSLTGAGPFVVSGDNKGNRVSIVPGADCTVVASNLVLDVSSAGGSALDLGNRPYAVTLLLAGTNTFAGGKNCAGICIESGKGSLAISNLDATATLDVRGGEYAAGIGGGASGAGGSVTISGGGISVSSGIKGAGIGGGQNGAGGTVTIFGGTVVATGDTRSGAEDIGYGVGGSSSGRNTFAGGSISLSHGSISSAPSNTTESVFCVTFTNVTDAATLADIKAGLAKLSPSYGVNDITAPGGNVYAWLPNGVHMFTIGGKPSIARVNGANTTVVPFIPAGITVNGQNIANGFGKGWTYTGPNLSLTGTGPFVISGSNVQGTTTNAVSIVPGADCTVVVSNLFIDMSSAGASALFVGTKPYAVTLLFAGTNTLAGGGYCAGIDIESGDGSLIVSNLDAAATLDVRGGNYAAGIGGPNEKAGGTVNISGGTVTATGGNDGAGIGGGNGGAGGTVTISGGFVTAVGGSLGAGIGGGTQGAGGTVMISGGTVTASSPMRGAGIGGGQKGAGGMVTISGGAVSATGGLFASGIGGGLEGAGGMVTISGGRIKAVSGMQGGAGIGGGLRGAGGTVTISGGTVIAQCNADSNGKDIGLGEAATASGTNTFTGGSILLSNGSISLDPQNGVTNVYCVTFTNITSAAALADIKAGLAALSPAYGVKDITNLDGKVYAWLPNGTHVLEIGGKPWQATVKDGPATAEHAAYVGVTVDGRDIVYQSGAGWTYAGGSLALTNAGPFVISGNNGGNTVLIQVQADCTVVASNLVIDVSSSRGSALYIGDNPYAVTLLLAGTNTFAGGLFYAGVCIEGGAGSLTISNLDATATLTARGGSNGGAGIGGGSGSSCGRVTISGGNVFATGGSGGAGIGGGAECAGGTVTISGGNVFATGGSGGAGIGGGDGCGYNGGAGGTVTISGGFVTAVGSGEGAGIGGGWYGAGGMVTISGGTVCASGNESCGNIGPGMGGTPGVNTFTGGSIFLSNGSLSPGPQNGVMNVSCVTFTNITSAAALADLKAGLAALSPAYGVKDITAISNSVYAWLPNGTYIFEICGDPWKAVVRGYYYGTTARYVPPVGVTVNGRDLVYGSVPGGGWTYTDRTNLILSGTGPYVISGNNGTNIVSIQARADCAVVASNLVIDVGGTGHVTPDQAGVPAFDCGTNAVSLALWSDAGRTNTFKGGVFCAGIAVVSNAFGAASLAVTNLNEAAILSAVGGKAGAGIGGGFTNTCGRVTIAGGRVVAMGGEDGAGIGGGVGGAGGVVAIAGGRVVAAGGPYGAGIGGGIFGDGGTVTVSGGTVEATGFGDSDIGPGLSADPAGTNTFTGGSVRLANALVAPAPSNGVARVWRVLLAGFAADAPVALSGLAGYGTNDIFADADGRVHLWLPDGSYAITAGGTNLTFDVDGAPLAFGMDDVGVAVNGIDISRESGKGWTYADTKHLVLSGAGPYVICGNNGTNIVSIRADAACEVIASNLTVDVSGKDNVTAFDCGTNAVTLALWSDAGATNIFKSGSSQAGIAVVSNASGVASLTIMGLNDAAALLAVGGGIGAGIGGNIAEPCGSVTVSGGRITAIGGVFGAGIGGSEGGTVTISGGTVVARGDIARDADDIGFCTSGLYSGANTFTGGSILPVNGSVSLVPSNGTTMVSVAVASGYAPGERVTSFPAWLPSYYGTNDVFADASGAVYLWIPGVEVTYDAAGGVFADGSTLVTNVLTAAAGYVLPSATFFAHRLAGWQAEDGTPVTNGMPLLSYAAHTLSARWETFFCAADTNAVSACGGGSCGGAACPLLCACKTSAQYDGFLYEIVSLGTSTVQAVTGLLTVDIRKSGSSVRVKAKVKAGSAKVPFNNLVSVDGCAVTLASGSGEVLSLSFAGDRVSGTLAAGSRLATPAAVDGARNRYKDKSDAAAQALGAKIAGTYTAAMALGDSACTGPRDIRPAGYGCLAVKITSLGKVSVLGRLPDGTSVSCSTAALAYDGCGAGEVLLPFLGAKGALGGLLLLDADAKTLSSGADFGWAFLWRRAAKADDGFDALLDAAGGAYAKPSDTAALTFTGDFSSLPEYWLKGSGHAFDAALLPENVAVTRAGAKFTAGANGAKLRLKLTLSNGLVAGGFTAYAQVDGRARAKSVKLYGALLQPAAGAGASPAFFGAALLRDDDPAVKTSRAVRSAPVWME